MSTNRLGSKIPEDDGNLLYGIVSCLKDGVVVLDPALKVIFLNKAATLLYGLELSQRSPEHNDQLDGLFFPDRITPCSLTELPFFKTGHGGASPEIELYIQRPDGVGTVVSITGSPLPGKDGDALGWLVTLADMTRQKQREHELRLQTEHLEDALSLIGTTEDITELRQSENSLRSTLASLMAVYDNLPFLAWMKDREGRYLLANKHWLQAVGIDEPMNLNGITDYDIWPKELAEHYRSTDQQVVTSRQQLLLTEKTLNEGRETWIETIKAPIIDDKDQVLGTTGIARDITDSLSAEQQLHKFSKRLRLASKAAAIGICEWDVSSGLADWDERNYEIFGIPQGTPIDYRTWAKLVFPEDLPNSTIKLRKLLHKKQEIHWELRIRRQNDGALRYIQASAIPAFKANGEVHKIIGVNLDVTDFKQIEIELDEKRAHLSEAQALANLGSWSLDFISNVFTCSDECHRIFGMAAATPLSYECVLTQVHPDDQAYVDAKWTAALQGEPHDIQYRILVDGKVKWIRERVVLESSSDGRLLRAIGTSQDITELKLIEKTLESSRLQLRQLAARRERTREEERKRIARDIHDGLGQMLTSLRMEIALLRINFAGDNTQLLENIQSITLLLDNTIQVTREVATKLRPTVLEMGIGPALEWLVKTTALQSGIEFDIFYSESDLDLDEEAAIVVFRIVQESINNVLKHAQATKMTISMKVESGNYLLEIDDNGKGFDYTAPREVNALGLIGIQERAIMLGGEAIILSTQGKGTLIQVLIPVNTAWQRR
ncbi:MAG: PAS domain-containing protein [Methylococcales bacterium]|nr:PAS domain-containing protein [Methylococcales bacterium]